MFKQPILIQSIPITRKVRSGCNFLKSFLVWNRKKYFKRSIAITHNYFANILHLCTKYWSSNNWNSTQLGFARIARLRWHCQIDIPIQTIMIRTCSFRDHFWKIKQIRMQNCMWRLCFSFERHEMRKLSRRNSIQVWFLGKGELTGGAVGFSKPLPEIIHTELNLVPEIIQGLFV